MTKPIEVLLVDQDADTRFTIRRTLAHSSIDVVGEAPFGTEAVNRAVTDNPDVVLCALEEPLIRPLETIEALRYALPETPLIVYSSHRDIEIARKAMVAGARDFLVLPLTREAVESAVFNILGSEEERRGRLSGRGAIGFEGTVVAVYSAKGGVGKTTFATNLAVALARDVGQSVAIIDVDMSFGDVAVAMGMPPADVGIGSLIDDLRSGVRADIGLHTTKHPSGADVIAAPADPIAWNTIRPEEVIEVIELSRQTHDYVVIDLSAAPNPITLAVLGASSVAFWILTPDVNTMHDNLQAKRLLDCRLIEPDDIRYILNHIQAQDEVSRAAIEDAIESEIYWEIPHDPRLYERTQLGVALKQPGRRHRGGAASIAALASALAGVTPQRGHRKPGPLSRIRALVGTR